MLQADVRKLKLHKVIKQFIFSYPNIYLFQKRSNIVGSKNVFTNINISFINFKLNVCKAVFFIQEE